MTSLCRGAFGACLAMIFAGSALAQTGNVDEARRLAQSGRRLEALTLLDARLMSLSTDADARTLRGTVLSWQGRYDEARADLEHVLAGAPLHAEALQALARMELWDGHPDRSEAWAARGLVAHPGDIDLMEVRALALEALKRTREGLTQINAALRREPARDSALRIRRRLIDRQPVWLSGASFRWDRFDDRRGPWQETQLSVARQSRFGSIGVRAYGARRFGQSDAQVEIEAYPQLRRGTYAYVAAAFAPRATFYPRRRLSLDVYQTLGGGWEASAGARELDFGAPVRVYTTALAKYAGNWLYSGRAWITPRAGQAAVTIDLAVRRYRADGESYLGARYAHGRYRDDVQRADVDGLSSESVTGEITRRVGRSYLSAFVTVSREDRTATAFVWQSTVGVATRVKF